MSDSPGSASPVDVVGGGIGGLTAALAFARRGHATTILERADALRTVGAGLQVTPNGGRVLEALGLGPALDAVSVAAQAVEPHDGLTGRRLGRFDLARRGPYRFVHRADLVALLADAAVAAGATIRTGIAVLGAQPSGRLALADRTEREAGLVVGADGIRSRLRPILNPHAPDFFTGQVAWRAIVVADHPPVARIWMLPGRHVVSYPLTGGRVNLVMVREQADWVAEDWDQVDAPEAMRGAFADAALALGNFLDRVGRLRLWGLFRHPVAARWQAGRLALLGDAAHPTLPFLAQGANLALEDAWVLADLVSRFPLDEALRRYQAVRSPRVSRAIAQANAQAVNYHLRGLRRRVAHGGLSILSRAAPDLFLDRLDWLHGADVTRT